VAIAFPRDLPAGIALYHTDFDIKPMVELSPTQGGDPILNEVGPALWKCSFKTQQARGPAFRAMRAWLKSIKSPPQPFWSPDLRARYPRAYQGGFPALVRAGGGAFDGTCVLASVGDDGVTVGLSTLPVGFTLGPDDALAFDYGTASRAYHTLISDIAMADAEGNLTVEVRPVVRPGFVAGTTVVNLDNPKAKFLMVPGSNKEPRDEVGMGNFSFDAIQTLL
jgi:hypothetical protein